MKNPYKTTIQGFSNPGSLRTSRELPDTTIVVEHDELNLIDCVGLIMWNGNATHPFEAKKFCRVALTSEQALVLGNKLVELAQLVQQKQEFKDAVKDG